MVRHKKIKHSSQNDSISQFDHILYSITALKKINSNKMKQQQKIILILKIIYTLADHHCFQFLLK